MTLSRIAQFNLSAAVRRARMRHASARCDVTRLRAERDLLALRLTLCDIYQPVGVAS